MSSSRCMTLDGRRFINYHIFLSQGDVFNVNQLDLDDGIGILVS